MDADEVRRLLEPDEPDYAAAALLLGAGDVVHLAALAAGEDPMMASKAVYLAGMLEVDGVGDVLTDAAGNADPIVRVAAAASVRNAEASVAVALGTRLLADADVGVRRMVADSAALSSSADVGARLRRLVERDADVEVRSRAELLLDPDDREAARTGHDGRPPATEHVPTTTRR
jgi:hypothetical protein